MKNIAAIAIWIALALGVIGGCWYLYDSVTRIVTPPAQGQLGSAFDISSAFFLTAGTGGTGGGVGMDSATTTVIYLNTTDTASSTIIGYSGRANTLDLNLMAVASTSATSKLQWFVSFSPNKIDWYKEDCSSVDSTVLVTHGASACVHAWTITGSGRQTKNVGVGTAQAKYFKIDFGVTGANASLWADVVPREISSNPI